MYFYRDSHGLEIDLLLARGQKVRPIEIKTSATYNEALVKSLLKFVRARGGEAIDQPTLVYSGEPGVLPNGIQGVHFGEAGIVVDV